MNDIRRAEWFDDDKCQGHPGDLDPRCPKCQGVLDHDPTPDENDDGLELELPTRAVFVVATVVAAVGVLATLGVVLWAAVKLVLWAVGS